MVLIAGASVVRFAPALNISERVKKGWRASNARTRAQRSHIMMVIRPVERDDLPQLLALAGKPAAV